METILPTDTVEETPLNHPLATVYSDVIRQVMYGKGRRHGGSVTPFLEQSWLAVANVHGIGFLTGQAQKKMNEAVENNSLLTDYPAWERELLGAIAYMGMALIYARRVHQPT
jgi:hypothetical protein